MSDAHKNFAYSTVLTAPSPASSGTSLIVAAAEGARFPAVPFNATIWPEGEKPTPTNAEIVRVTAISTDTFTITRAQESTSARAVVADDQIAATVTALTMQDAENVHYETRSTNTILGYADKGKAIDITAAITQTFEADETLGDGWWIILRNATDEGTVAVVLNPTGSETIDGLTTVTMYSGEARLIMCNGAGGNFNSIFLCGGFARFSADDNFIVPHGITAVTVECIGGGGGGGGGRGAAAGGVRQGGTGGGGGARHRAELAASALGTPGDSIAIDIAVGGTSGGGGSSANGSVGGAGGTTTFGSIHSAFGGGGGVGGSNSTGSISGGGGGGYFTAGGVGVINDSSQGGDNFHKSTAPTSQTHVGMSGMGGAGAGCGAHASAGQQSRNAEWGGASGGPVPGGGGGGSVGAPARFGGCGGAGGGGLSTGNTETVGGVGGSAGGTGGTAGAVDGGSGGIGGTGNLNISGSGGGGGGSQASGTGGVGGDGGAPGGGAGGGAGGTTVGGAGGVGGAGECRVWYS